MQPSCRTPAHRCVRRSSAVIVPFHAPKTSTPPITTGDDSIGEPTRVVPEQLAVGAAQHPDVAVHPVHDELVVPRPRATRPSSRAACRDARSRCRRACRARARSPARSRCTRRRPRRPPGTRSACRARATRRRGTAAARGSPAAPACASGRRRTSSTAPTGGRSRIGRLRMRAEREANGTLAVADLARDRDERARDARAERARRRAGRCAPSVPPIGTRAPLTRRFVSPSTTVTWTADGVAPACGGNRTWASDRRRDGRVLSSDCEPQPAASSAPRPRGATPSSRLPGHRLRLLGRRLERPAASPRGSPARRTASSRRPRGSHRAAARAARRSRARARAPGSASRPRSAAGSRRRSAG